MEVQISKCSWWNWTVVFTTIPFSTSLFIFICMCSCKSVHDHEGGHEKWKISGFFSGQKSLGLMVLILAYGGSGRYWTLKFFKAYIVADLKMVLKSLLSSLDPIKRGLEAVSRWNDFSFLRRSVCSLSWKISSALMRLFNG